ncbi:hypothetical protein HORIV_28730 [Vreelandella olivaria]|uniref:Peptidase M48 domain-containing protein n=1 Tax=Vreelandella olivaria TaxID=390919 RepID=A0ABM7GED6_9GAMM|nr:hypothetical protein HORIV_28730 [Halomonas olivaria]
MVQCVAEKVVAGAEASYPGLAFPERWEVVVFEDASPNAFALPGGRIGVHSGLLRVAETPAQLAAVIGHEVGHVLANHGNERLTQQLGIKAVLLVVGLLGEEEFGNQQLMQALGIGAQLGISLPFSRTHEEEADLMGLEIMARAGFDPQGSVALWRNMAASGGGQPLNFFLRILPMNPAFGHYNKGWKRPRPVIVRLRLLNVEFPEHATNACCRSIIEPRCRYALLCLSRYCSSSPTSYSFSTCCLWPSWCLAYSQCT